MNTAREEKQDKATKSFLFDIDKTLLICLDSKTKIINPIIVCAIQLALKIAPQHTKLVTFRNGYTSFLESAEKALLGSRDLKQNTFAHVIEGLRVYGIDRPLPIVTRYLPVIEDPIKHANPRLKDALDKLKESAIFSLENIIARETKWLQQIEEAKDESKLENLKLELTKAMQEFKVLQEFEESIEGQIYNCIANKNKAEEYLFASGDATDRVVTDDDLKYVIPTLKKRSEFITIHYDKNNVLIYIETFINQLPKSCHNDARRQFISAIKKYLTLVPENFPYDEKEKLVLAIEKIQQDISHSDAASLSQYRQYGHHVQSTPNENSPEQSSTLSTISPRGLS